MTDALRHRNTLIEQIGGYMTAHAIGVIADLGVADHIGTGTRTGADLAAATGTNEQALTRVLRMLAAAGLCTEPEPGRFGLTAVGDQLRGDSPHSLRAFARTFCHPALFAAWAELKHTVVTGEQAFAHVHGASFYDHLATDPAMSALFNEAMGEESRSSAAHLAQSHDFGDAKTIVDLGGGDGTLLAAILGPRPGLRGIVFDTRVDGAPAVLDAAGVADRCDVRSGSFFADIPADGDLYVIKSVFQDWPDEQMLDILRSCRAQMPAHARLMIVGSILPDTAAPGAPIVYFTDVDMLVTTGGRERTDADLRAMLSATGFTVESVAHGAAGPLAVLIATPGGAA